jgi:hypothetical protein
MMDLTSIVFDQSYITTNSSETNRKLSLLNAIDAAKHATTQEYETEAIEDDGHC